MPNICNIIDNSIKNPGSSSRVWTIASLSRSSDYERSGKPGEKL
jgi:hypothetical protein